MPGSPQPSGDLKLGDGPAALGWLSVADHAKGGGWRKWGAVLHPPIVYRVREDLTGQQSISTGPISALAWTRPHSSPPSPELLRPSTSLNPLSPVSPTFSRPFPCVCPETPSTSNPRVPSQWYLRPNPLWPQPSATLCSCKLRPPLTPRGI